MLARLVLYFQFFPFFFSNKYHILFCWHTHACARTRILKWTTGEALYVWLPLLTHKSFNCRSSIRQRRNPKETADLTSIQELIDEIDCNCHSGKFLIKWRYCFVGLKNLGDTSLTYSFVGLLEVVRHCTYIGMADDVFALLQHDTHLYLANVVNLRYNSMASVVCCVALYMVESTS